MNMKDLVINITKRLFLQKYSNNLYVGYNFQLKKECKATYLGF